MKIIIDEEDFEKIIRKYYGVKDEKRVTVSFCIDEMDDDYVEVDGLFFTDLGAEK